MAAVAHDPTPHARPTTAAPVPVAASSAVPPPRITVLRALGLGDLLTAVPALRGLRRAFPHHTIELAAPGALAPLAALTGAVDETVDCAPLAPLPERLHGADIAVNLHGRGPQSHAVLRASRPARTIAFADGPWARGPSWRTDEHETVRWCRMLAAHGIAADPRDLRLDAPRVDDGPAPPGSVVLHPGAAAPARRWPVERFATVARALTHAGEHVVVTGGPDDAEDARAIVTTAGLPAERSVAGATDLITLTATVADACCLIAGDTGVGHLATALGTPSVLLFGPTSPAHWGPVLGQGRAVPRHRVLWAGRIGDPHGDTADPGLLQITPEQVLHAFDDVRAAGRD